MYCKVSIIRETGCNFIQVSFCLLVCLFIHFLCFCFCLGCFFFLSFISLSWKQKDQILFCFIQFYDLKILNYFNIFFLHLLSLFLFLCFFLNKQKVTHLGYSSLSLIFFCFVFNFLTFIFLSYYSFSSSKMTRWRNSSQNKEQEEIMARDLISIDMRCLN